AHKKIAISAYCISAGGHFHTKTIFMLDRFDHPSPLAHPLPWPRPVTYGKVKAEAEQTLVATAIGYLLQPLPTYRWGVSRGLATIRPLLALLQFRVHRIVTGPAMSARAC